MSIDELQRRFDRQRRRLDQLAGEYRVLHHSRTELSATLQQLQADIELYTRAAGVLSTLGEDKQNDTQRAIETLVTAGLQTIFGAELSFHLVPAVRSSTPVVDFVVRTQIGDDPPIDTSVMDARGGGLAAIVGFLLRLVVLLLSKDRQQTVLVLDETFAHLSAEYEGKLAEFLRDLVDKTGVQIIMVTHSSAYTDAADICHRFELVDGVTHVRSS